MSKILRIWSYDCVKRWQDRAAWLARAAAGSFAITKAEVRRVMRRRVKPRFWLIMIALTLIVFATSFAVMNRRYAQGEQRLKKAQAERDELILQVSALSEKLAFAQTDDYVIRTARDELGMIIPGEVRYVNGAR